MDASFAGWSGQDCDFLQCYALDEVVAVTDAELINLAQLIEKSALHLAEIRQNYTRRYPGQWIAVYNDQVFGPRHTPEELLTLLSGRGVMDAAQVAYLDEAYFLPGVFSSR